MINNELKYKALTVSYRERLQKGNLKIHNAVGIFNLPAGESCLNNSTCKATCYAQQRELMYKNVRESRAFNYELAQNDVAFLEYLITKQLSKGHIPIVRIHESGDFFSSSYVQMWINIAISFPDVKFYAYTKVFKGYAFSSLLRELDTLNNVNIINSLIDDKYRNYGNKEYLDKLKSEYKCFECPLTGCMDTCSYCLDNDNVVFPIHGIYKNKEE